MGGKLLVQFFHVRLEGTPTGRKQPHQRTCQLSRVWDTDGFHDLQPILLETDQCCICTIA